MTREEIAKLLHDEYEAQARQVGWKPRDARRVEFEDLPEANRQVMLRVAGLLEDLLSKLEESRNLAYRERDQLVAALSKVWESHLCRHPEEDVNWEREWRWIVCIHSPVGQLTWHIHDRERPDFDHLEVKENDWDGHTTEEKYRRLARLTVHNTSA